MGHKIRIFLVSVLALSFGACSTGPKNQISLMPAPDVYDHANLTPLIDHNPIEDIPYGGILYVTDREPSKEQGKYYLDDRGHVLRVGVAKTVIGEKGMTWEEARRISLLKERPKDYPIRVAHVEEFGILDRSINSVIQSHPDAAKQVFAEKPFADKINEKLAVSKRKDVYIYVHGYKVVFENPLLVASELWHFLGYEGVFIAYAWPSTPKKTAYFKDLETASLSAVNLRIFIQYLAEKTDASRIHIIGYSAGTRVVVDALHQLALMQTEVNRKDAAKGWRIGHVILTGSDMDLHLFAAYLADGLLDAAEDITAYASSADKALDMSYWVFGRRRLGQTVSDGLSDVAKTYLRKNEKLIVVNATEAPGAASGNGHAYFRKSPWTSSDILVTLLYSLKPDQRGLELAEDQAIWTFSKDYKQKLHNTLLQIDSELISK